MIETTVVKRGPIFEKDLDVTMFVANLEAAKTVGPLLAQRLAANYSGGIVRSGPGRFGHLGNSIRWAVSTARDSVAVRAFPLKVVAFKARFLEFGHRGGYRKAGGSGLLLPKEGRDRRAKAQGHAAALKIGPLFRRQAQPGPSRAFHVVQRTQDEVQAEAFGIFNAAIAKAVGATGSPP